ncbi:MAG TPA: HigA family addiction module antitoxin [Oligoflexia bacterium]|nr:HigA family addiction module antitoxin [Oligoflexia bacterium]
MAKKKQQTYIIPLHPGEMLQDELNSLGISQSALARRIKATNAQINDICRGKRGISADMAVRLSRALGASPEFWLNAQKLWELSKVEEKKYEDIEPFSEAA